MRPGESFFSSRLITIALWFFAVLCAIPVLARTANEPIAAPAVVDFPYAVIHFNRPLDDYGDHTTGDFNDFWGLHLWGSAIDTAEATEWTVPKPFLGEDEFGRFAWIARSNAASQINFIVHRGDVKDGTNDDRFFDADLHPEIWINADDGNIYTSQAEAQGFVTVHYHRDDGDYGTPGPDFNTFWGLHVWGAAIDVSEATEWSTPKVPDGIGPYGVFWNIQIDDASQPVNFIIHRGDTKDVGPDEQFVPISQPTVWRLSGDTTLYPSQSAAEELATIHYHRPAGDYGTPSPDFNSFWGLHVWTGAMTTTEWLNPMPPDDLDLFGAIFEVPLVDAATELAYILHQGDTKDPGPDQFLGFAEWGYEVWQVQGADPAAPYVYPLRDPGGALPVELVEFTVHLDADRALLNWQTATEANNAGFDVEHRAPTDESWRRVGFVEGYGTTLVPQLYVFIIDDLMPGKHSFRLRQFDYSGAFTYSPEVEISLDLRSHYFLGSAYPNPFNSQTTLPFAVAQGGHVQLTLHNVLGQQVSVLFEGVIESGQTRTVRVDGQTLPGGIYFVRLASESVEANEQLVLLK